jgi:hypothetical protein
MRELIVSATGSPRREDALRQIDCERAWLHEHGTALIR